MYDSDTDEACIVLECDDDGKPLPAARFWDGSRWRREYPDAYVYGSWSKACDAAFAAGGTAVTIQEYAESAA